MVAFFRRLGRSRDRELAGVVCAAGLIWWLKWLVFGFQPLTGDGQMYIDMARGLPGEPPWSFHILTPRLAGLLFPGDPVKGFFWIAAGSFAGTAAAIDLLLRRVGFQTTRADRLLGVGLFMATCTGAFMFRAYFMTDSLSYFLLAVSCAATLYGRDGVVAAATLLGVFNRETAAFVIPVWIVWNARKYAIGALIERFAFVFGAAIAGYILLQYTPFVLGFEPTRFNYLSFENMLTLWRTTLSWLGTENIYYGLAICVFLAYGPVWFVAVRGVVAALTLSRDERRPLIALSALLVPVLSTVMIVDWRRGSQPLFPAVIALAVLGIRALAAGRPGYCWMLLAVTTTLAAAVTTDAWSFTPMRTPVIIAMAPWLVVVTLVLSRPRAAALNI